MNADLRTLISLGIFVAAGIGLVALGEKTMAATLFGIAGGMALPHGAGAVARAAKGGAAKAALLLVLGLLALTTNGCSAGARQMALKISLTTLNGAHAGYVAWDDQEQTKIVATSHTRDEAEERLAAHKIRREPASQAFELAYMVWSNAAADETVSLSSVAAAVDQAVFALAAMKGPDNAGSSRPRRRQGRTRDPRSREGRKDVPGGWQGRARAYARRVGRERRPRRSGSRQEVSGLRCAS